MSAYKHGLLAAVVVCTLWCPAQRSDACCPPPNVYMPTWKFWVVPNHLLVIPAYEYTCMCIDHWNWTYPSGVTYLPPDSAENHCYSYYLRHGYFKFGNVGTYDHITAYAYTCCDPDVYDSDWARVYVVTMGISPSTPPYPYIQVNDDDDNANGVMDMYDPNQPKTAQNDDDLVPLTLSVNSPRSSPDVVELALFQDLGALRVWKQQNRYVPLITSGDDHETWTPGSNWSKTVYVEGMYPSGGTSLTDPKLAWRYWGDSYHGENLYGWDDSDAACKRQWTVVRVDMDMDGVADDQTGGGDPHTQEITPGGFIPLGSSTRLVVRPVMPALTIPSWPDVTLSVEYSGSGQIEVWDATHKIDLPHPFSPTSDTTFWVKGTHESIDPCDVKLILTHGITSFKDRINLTIVKIQVDGVGFKSDHMVKVGYNEPNIDDPDGSTAVWGFGYSAPVCYTRNTPVTMFAGFSVYPAVRGSGITGVTIRAKVGTTVIGSAAGCEIIGVVVEDPPHTDGYVHEISGGSPVPSSDVIGTLTPTFTWEMSTDGTHWFSVGTSGPHTMYWTYSTPQAPQTIPWIPVLEKSCSASWAGGQTTVAGAAGAVVNKVYGSGYEYDNVNGRPQYVDPNDEKFRLTACLSTWGDSNKPVNCWDCANMVCIFANALGCNLNSLYMTKAGGFYLNYIKPIGRGWTNDPFPPLPKSPFSCHWTAGDGSNIVYDACLQVDDDNDPTTSPYTGRQPINMIFDAGTPHVRYDDYRGKLVDPADANSVSASSDSPSDVK